MWKWRQFLIKFLCWFLYLGYSLYGWLFLAGFTGGIAYELAAPSLLDRVVAVSGMLLLLVLWVTTLKIMFRGSRSFRPTIRLLIACQVYLPLAWGSCFRDSEMVFRILLGVALFHAPLWAILFIKSKMVPAQAAGQESIAPQG